MHMHVHLLEVHRNKRRSGNMAACLEVGFSVDTDSKIWDTVHQNEDQDLFDLLIYVINRVKQESKIPDDLPHDTVMQWRFVTNNLVKGQDVPTGELRYVTSEEFEMSIAEFSKRHGRSGSKHLYVKVTMMTPTLDITHIFNPFDYFFCKIFKIENKSEEVILVKILELDRVSDVKTSGEGLVTAMFPIDSESEAAREKHLAIEDGFGRTSAIQISPRQTLKINLTRTFFAYVRFFRGTHEEPYQDREIRRAQKYTIEESEWEHLEASQETKLGGENRAISGNNSGGNLLKVPSATRVENLTESSRQVEGRAVISLLVSPRSNISARSMAVSEAQDCSVYTSQVAKREQDVNAIERDIQWAMRLTRQDFLRLDPAGVVYFLRVMKTHFQIEEKAIDVFQIRMKAVLFM
eukprot:443981-Amorphochlora_amoeboformis.AAC.2